MENSYSLLSENANILVVDDTAENLTLLTSMLKDCGYLARPVTSGRLALQAAKSEKPDLILLDIAMPEMNGYEVCQRLKQDPQLSEVPVIFISALSQTSERLKAFEVGGVDFIKMPFQFEEVRARVDAHIKLYRLQMSLKDRVRRSENANILVVDDTAENLTLLTRMLNDCGYLARPVTNGRLALQAAKSEKPELILLDTTMPEMDGYQVCQRLKQDPQLSEVPVIFISALSQTSERLKAFEVGGVDFIKMPFQFEEVRARVDAHIKLYRLQMSLENQVRRQVKTIAAAMRDRIWLWATILISTIVVLISSFIIMSIYKTQDSQNEYQVGYYIGHYAGFINASLEPKVNVGLIDPTSEQVINLNACTDCTQSGVGSKIRCQIASDCLMKAAASKGYKSHLVVINDYKYALRSHALVAFNTIDKGSVYVEPQTMKIVDVNIDKLYSFLKMFYVSEMLVYP